ncbi:MAG: alkaline phosphatase family protein [Acidobacteriota bacterium]
MARRKFLQFIAILIALTGIMYVMISLYVSSPRRLIFGVDKRSGAVRTAAQGLLFLPPHQFYRLSFETSNGSAVRDGFTWLRSKEGVPFGIFYRLRFGIGRERLPDSKRLVQEGWSAWIRARVSEAVSVVAREFPIEQLTAPTADFSRERELLRAAVARHLAQSGLQVSGFEIQKIEIDRDALRDYKRAELRRNARGPVGRVALFAIDGADWELLSELIKDDRLPNIKALIQGGVTGSVQTLQPTIAPLLWTTVATGSTPDRHGVLDYFDSRGGELVNSSSRRVPPLWDICDAFGRSAAVVSWWTAWPPLENSAAVFDLPVLSADQAIYPPELAPLVQSSAIPADTITYSQISRFLNITAAEYQNALAAAKESDPIIIFRSVLAKTWTDHRAGIEIYRNRKPMLMMLNWSGTDAINHIFGPFHPPMREGISSENYRKFWPTVTNYYSELDREIGEWMRVISDQAPDTTVILLSAHGMEWGKSRPDTLPQGGSGLFAHQGPGVFIAWGNHIRPNRGSHTLALYDIAPTVLGLLGLPKSNDMPGTFLAWAFDDVTPIESVHVGSYRDLITARNFTSAVERNTAPVRARLEELGHIADPNRVAMPLQTTQSRSLTREQWGLYAYYNNLGVQLMEQSKSTDAKDAFERAIGLNPDRPIPYLNLSVILFDKQQYSKADEMFQQALIKGLPKPENYIVDFAALYRTRDMTTRAISLLRSGKELFPQSYLIAANFGSALMAGERYAEGLTELERALALRPTSTLVLNDLGLYYYQKKDPARAIDYWNRSLTIDARQPDIRRAVTSVQARM